MKSTDPARRRFLAGTATAGLVLAAGDLGTPVAATPYPSMPQRPALAGLRERLSLDGGWRFLPRDVPFAEARDHEASYSNAKAGNATGAASTDYDDGEWARVDLPHDFALTQPYDRTANPDEGYRPRGIGWYRRTFALDPADRGRHLELEFGAVSTFATVWLNGTLVHRHFSGFTGFTIDLTPFALFGEDLNTLVVRVDAIASEGWWYEGAGIYRHVWLTKRHPVHVVTDGIHADPRRGRDGGWLVPIEVALANSGDEAVKVEIEAILIDPGGRVVATSRTPAWIAASGSMVASLSVAASTPRLWSPDTPTLYALRTLLRLGGSVVDAVEITIGFRTILFDAERGFFLNEAPLKIQGVCAHQDHAGVGVAVPDSLWDFRVRRMKAMGANALRCSHNAPAVELLDACDRLGLLVMNENRNFNASEDYLPQLEWLVRRDRNHPSVILWSLCNEESLQSSAIGVEMVRRMKTVVKALDSSRPVTAAMNGGMFATVNIAQELDVVGLNYGAGDYDRFHAANPTLPMISSEDTSAYMTRGVYATDAVRHVLAADDREHMSFGLSHRESWKRIAERPFMAGGFAWTGFDYRGEPAPFDWPTAVAQFGAMDLCGFAKTAFHIRRALWFRDEPVLAIAPHWTWPGREGQLIEVMAITNADRVVLSLNDRVVADLLVDRFAMATSTVPYAPGRLSAIAYRGGQAVARTSVETTGPAVRIRLTPDRRAIDGDGRDALPVTVQMLDAAGRPIPTADQLIEFTVTGGHILGLGNGDPSSHEPDRPDGNAGRRSLFGGLAQVIVQTIGGGDDLVLIARAAGVRSGLVSVPVTPVRPVRSVDPADAVQSLTEWRQSPGSQVRPDPNEKLAENDMNSWGWSKPGSTENPLPDGRYCRFRVAFVPWRAVRAKGGRLVFGRLAGCAEIWLDGMLAKSKTDPGIDRIDVLLPAGDREHVVTVLFDAPAGSPAFGIAGTVTVEPGN